MALAIGSRLGPYEILAPLGAGGMGEVYLAMDPRLQRKVAIKLLTSPLTRDPDRVRRFEQEARAASALNHPNIITIYDIGEDESGRFIAMEYVAGRTLREAAGDRVTIELLIAWGRQIAQALGVAHAAGIVHRDIKPENIMVRDDGYVKVLDFGLARLAPEHTDNSSAATRSATSPGTLLGTVRYMSPEQARGDTVSGASDMFALGTVLYELATGQHPLHGTTLLGLLQAIAAEVPVAPSRLAQAIPSTLDKLLLCLMDKDERRRPKAAEVEAALMDVERAPSFLPLAPSSSRSVVGRERERSAFKAAFASVKSGRGLILCVAGEPGIGKTTLVEDFLAELAASPQPSRIARGRCSERLAGTEAYLPWLEALESLRRDDGGRPAGRAGGSGGAPVAQAMRRVAPTWYAQVVPVGGNDSDAALLAELKSASQERLKRELGALLEELSRDQPLLLFFDDLHWADVSTIDLLAFLGSRLATMPVLIVTTYRPSDLALAKHPFLRIKPDLQSRGVCRELALEFLTQAEIAAYLALEFPGHRFPAAFPALIHAKTEGSPLFMADLVRDLRDRGAIALEDGGWVLGQTLPIIEGELPESVRGMIERKIAQVSDDDRRLLVAASVQGYQFDSAVVAKAIGADETDVEERLETLASVFAFVRLVGEEEFPDRTLTLRYRFVHVLYQSALYGTLGPSRRASLSKAVVAALIQCYGEQRGRVAAELANLCEASRDFGQAAEYFLLAARNAARVFANHEVIALARRGLAALEALPDTLARAQQELALQITMGWPLMNTRGYAAAEVQRTLVRAHELCGRVDDPRQLCQVLWGLAMCDLVRAEYRRTRDRATEMLCLAQDIQEPALQVSAHYTLGSVLVYLGEMVEAREHFRQGIALCDASGRLRLTLPDDRDPSVSCRAQLARVMWLLGYPDQALTFSDTAQALANELGQPLAEAFALFLDMLLRQLRREAGHTRHRAESLLALARDHDLAQYAAWAEVPLGWACAAQGQSGGIERMREGLSRSEQMGSVLSRPHFLALLADILDREGQIEEGLAVVAEGLASVDRVGERYYEAELHRLQGELLRKAGGDDLREAAACFDHAIEVAKRQGAKSLELRAVMSLARLLQQQGRSAEARVTLVSIYGWFTEGFETPDLRDAKDLLDELAAVHP